MKHILCLAILLILTGCNIPKDKSPGEVMFGSMLESLGQSNHQNLVEQLTSDDADLRREAVLALSKGKNAKLNSTPELLGVVALDDKDNLVRVTAVEALAQFNQWPRLMDVLAQTATDKNVGVRLATVKVIDKNKCDRSLAILLNLMDIETDNEILSEIVGALGHYQNRRAIRALIETVSHDDFRVSFSSRQSLIALTDQDYQYDDDAWRKWLLESSQPLSNEAR